MTAVRDLHKTRVEFAQEYQDAVKHNFLIVKHELLWYDTDDKKGCLSGGSR